MLVLSDGKHLDVSQYLIPKNLTNLPFSVEECKETIVFRLIHPECFDHSFCLCKQHSPQLEISSEEDFESDSETDTCDEDMFSEEERYGQGGPKGDAGQVMPPEDPGQDMPQEGPGGPPGGQPEGQPGDQPK